MKLVLVRHAKAIDGFEFNGPDKERHLTSEGILEFSGVVTCLSRRFTTVDAIFVSPYVRAQETTLELKKCIKSLHEYTLDDIAPESSPDDSIRSIKRYLIEIANPDVAFVVGHEPHLGSLASLLITGSYQPVIDVKRGSAHCISFGGEIRPGEGILHFSIHPKLFALA